MFRCLKFLTAVLILNTCILNAKVTPTDVFVEAKAIKLVLAEESTKKIGVTLLPVIDIDLHGATPSTVYALGSSLNMKLMVYAQSINKPWKAARFPKAKIVPKNVKELLLVVQDNITSIFGNNNFMRETAEGKKPADVAMQLTYANQWLDQIMPFVKPQYPMAILKRTESYIDKIINKKNIEALVVNPKKREGIKPTDVFTNTNTTYSLIRNLKRVLGNQTSPIHPYNIQSATDQIKPLDVYSFTTFNLFFLYSLSNTINVNDIDTIQNLQLEEGVKPNDVFRQVDIVNLKLASVIALDKGL